MGKLFGGTPKMQQPKPVPQIDEALRMSRNMDLTRKRGVATTILTSDSGLPNLGATGKPKAYAT